MIRMTEVGELPFVLSGDDGGRTAAETAVVDASNGGVVVGEFGLNFENGYGGGGEFRFFGSGVRAVRVVIVGGH